MAHCHSDPVTYLGPRAVLAAPLTHFGGRLRRLVLRGALLAVGPWVRIHGAHRLAAVPDPVIFAFNHSNSFETLAVPAALFYLRHGRPIHFLIDWMYLHAAPIAPLFRLAGGIPVFTKPALLKVRDGFRRDARRRHSPPLEIALDHLRAGKSIGIFPEGTRNRDPHTLLRGRRGLGSLVLRWGGPVVPVGIDFPARRKSGRIPWLGKVQITVGEPLRFGEEHAAADAQPDLRRQLEQRVVDRVMAALSPLCGKSYPFLPRPSPGDPIPFTFPRGAATGPALESDS
jgi:1-acyl-sn-glycerol-3-phosphate acyltransferase